MAIMAEWKRKWQDIWFKNGFCTTLTGPEIENAAYTCRSVVHGGASLLASKLAWNYINCVMVKLQLCLIVLWAGLINSVPPSPVSPHRTSLRTALKHWRVSAGTLLATATKPPDSVDRLFNKPQLLSQAPVDIRSFKLNVENQLPHTV